MKVLVVGGTNFIGPRVVTRLAESGHEIVVFHRGRTEAALPESVGRVLGDRRNLEDFVGEFRHLAPEVVLDMIPMNEGDVRVLLGAFSGIARRFVAVSSQDVYRAYDIVRGLAPGPPDTVPLGEEAPLRERLYPYEIEGVEDYEKILVERVMMGDSKLPGTVLRLPMVYGPGDYAHRLFQYLKRMDDGRPAILLDENMARWRWTRGYAEDIAFAIALAVTDERATGRIYNFGEAEALSEAGWVEEIGRAAGWAGQVIAVPRGSLPPHLAKDYEGFNWNQHLIADTTRIRRELGYGETVARVEALRRTVEWEREHAPEKVDPAAFDYAAEDAALAGLKR